MFKKNNSISTSLSGLSDIDFSVPPTNNDILSYDSATLKWLPKAPITAGEATGISTYIIELSRWGITQGLPSKHVEVINSVNVNCYSNADYLKAYNNILGINNALSWAHSNGYRNVIMPNGYYSLCMALVDDNDKLNKIVIDYSNFTFDLNGSTFKVMFDSAKRSPYDKTRIDTQPANNIYNPRITPIYKFHTNNNFVGHGTFIIRDCNFTTLKNGILIGDKIDRDFAIQEEKAEETTTGISAGGNCQYINVENMDVSFFMGDGISTSIAKNNVIVKTSYDMAWQAGNIDATGLFVSSNTYQVSSFVAVSASTPHFLHGYGFTQGMTELRNKKYSIYFYDINKAFITSATQFVMRSFITTKSTAFIRLVVEENTYDSVGTGGWEMTLKTGYYGNYLTYQNNYIHHNHRGGMSQTLNDTFIINNTFYNNGERYDYENNLSGFEQADGNGFSTRYHINVEDSQGFNMQIIGNRFENGRLGIAARGYNYIIKNNWFKNNIGVLLYRVHYAIVKDNYFDNSNFETYPFDSTYNDLTDYIRHWYIEGNTIDGYVDFNGTAAAYSFSNNTVTGAVSIDCPIYSFKNNTFKMNKDLQTPELITLRKIVNIDGCTFVKNIQSTVKNSVLIYDALVTNCTFKNVKIIVKDVTLKDSFVTNSGFRMSETGKLKLDNCKINHGTYVILNYYETVNENSALFNFHDTTKIYNVEILNSDIVSTSADSIFNTYLGVAANISLKLENTVIAKQVNNKLGLNRLSGKLDFKNSTISSEVLISNITPNSALDHRFSDCTFINVSFTIKNSDVQYSQQDIGVMAKPLVGTGVPVGAPQKIGQEYFDLTNKKLYKAFGNSTASDWVVMN